MTPERFAAIERVCQAALELPPGERDAYLAEACGGDRDLRAEVASLLSSASEADRLFARPPGQGSMLVPGNRRRGTMPALAPGTRLGPYEIQSALGTGGMGEVYRARDSRLGRSVAIQVLSADVGADPDRRARLQREARPIAGLNHPPICTLLDVW
jgi:serine/threonine protein kinase